MKYLTYRPSTGESTFARVTSDEVIELAFLNENKRVKDVVEYLTLIDNGEDIVFRKTSDKVGEVMLLAPVQRSVRNIFCVGKNYGKHAAEFARSGFDKSSVNHTVNEEYPVIFTKTPQTIIPTGANIVFDSNITRQVDYEAELAVIIGKRGRRINKAKANEYIWGFTIVNDVTARDWQKRHKQWHLGKSFDTFCPMGPCAVSADEVNLSDTAVRCWVNGELRQYGNTRDMIFDVPTLIEVISSGIELLPGDVIATGTPAGVGIGFDPPKFLQNQDKIVIEIDTIGRLENIVKAT